MNKISKEIKPGIWVGLNTKIDWDNVKIEELSLCVITCPSTGKVKVRYGCKGYVIDHIDPIVTASLKEI